MSDQEQHYLDYLIHGAGFNNISSNNQSSENSSMISVSSLGINEYMLNQIKRPYEHSGKSVFSADLRLFVLENELNLVKKYLR